MKSWRKGKGRDLLDKQVKLSTATSRCRMCLDVHFPYRPPCESCVAKKKEKK